MQRFALCHAFEEICATNIIPNQPQEYLLQVSVEYSEETDTLEMRFEWDGLRYNPIEEGEALSISLAKAFLKNTVYTYEKGKNRLAVTL